MDRVTSPMQPRAVPAFITRPPPTVPGMPTAKFMPESPCSTEKRHNAGIPAPALALTTDSSALTAISNDYGFERVFARQVEALGRAGEVDAGDGRLDRAQLGMGLLQKAAGRP